ncbi:MAG: alpha/beta fold hydrolase [Rhodocyclaceae bacterium]
MNAQTERIQLVMLPGLVNDERLWERQASDLSDIVNTQIADISTRDSIGDLAEEVLAHAPTRFALVGLSMGGYVAMEIMRRAPERVIGLALCDTNARADTPEATARRRHQMALAQADFAQVIDTLAPGMFAPTHVGDTRLVMLFADMAANQGPDAFIRQQNAIIGRPDSLPGLANISCPTMILCGADDQLSSIELHREMADAIPDSELVVIRNAGHLSPIEQPKDVSAALRRWLERLH